MIADQAAAFQAHQRYLADTGTRFLIYHRPIYQLPPVKLAHDAKGYELPPSRYEGTSAAARSGEWNPAVEGGVLARANWSVFLGHASTTLAKFKVPEPEQRDVVAFVQTLRKEIIE